MSKNNISDKIKKISQDKIILILVIIFLLLGVGFIVYKVVTRNHLDSESNLVLELHDYFNSKDLSNCEGLLNYSEDKITYENIKPETRVCIAYQKSDLSEVETGTFNVDKKKDTCTEKGMTFRKDNEDAKVCSYTKINKSVIDNTYKKLYGKEIENNNSFQVDNLHICYLKDNYYYCGLSETFTYILGNESVIYRVVDKAVEERSELIIYDYFMRINNDNCFKTYTTTTINENCTDEYKKHADKLDYRFMERYGSKYKHVYKKAEDGSYYWISSEPVVEK